MAAFGQCWLGVASLAPMVVHNRRNRTLNSPDYSVLRRVLVPRKILTCPVDWFSGLTTDAAWLAQLLQHGLLKPSYIPPSDQRELRDLTRYRQSLVEDRARVLNRIQKLLESANLKLATVVTDVKGMSAQEMLRALVAGQTDPAILAQLAPGKLQKKQAELERALEGQFQEHHRFMLTRLLSHLDFFEAELPRSPSGLMHYSSSIPDSLRQSSGWIPFRGSTAFQRSPSLRLFRSFRESRVSGLLVYYRPS
jgi:hypothetical protein